jgi:hypothetical protein
MNSEIENVKRIVAKHERRIATLEGKLAVAEGPRKTRGSKRKAFSVKELIKEKKPKNYTETALAIGFYLENYEELDSFNVDDLDRGFRAAKETQPKNLNDTVNQNVKNGHMMECKAKKDGKKAWVLTTSGEDYVKRGFKPE